jgi:hypothetical protein
MSDVEIHDDPRAWDFQKREPTKWEGETQDYGEAGIGNRGAWIVRITEPGEYGTSEERMVRQEVVYVEEEIEAQEYAADLAKPGQTITIVRYANAGIPDDNEVRRAQQEATDQGGNVNAIPDYMRDIHNQ